MNIGLVAQSLRPLGCVCRLNLAWLAKYDDFERAWNECEHANWLAYLLSRVGFPYQRIANVVLEPSSDVPWIRQKLDTELARSLGYGTDEARHTGMFSLAVFFCQYADVPSSELAEAYRTEFTFDEVIEAMSSVFDSAVEASPASPSL